MSERPAALREPPPHPILRRAVGMGAATGAAGMLACAALCAAPAVALTAGGGVIAWLTGAHLWVAALAAVAVTGGGVWVRRRLRAQSQSRLKAKTRTGRAGGR